MQQVDDRLQRGPVHGVGVVHGDDQRPVATGETQERFDRGLVVGGRADGPVPGGGTADVRRGVLCRRGVV